MIVFCNDDTCIHNNGIACAAPNIVITVGNGTREDGSTGAINVCSDYEERTDSCVHL